MKKTLLLLLALQVSALSQDDRGQTPIIRASVDVVHVVCTIRDNGGDYVTNLKREDFLIYEDKVVQPIQFFHRETGAEAQPLSIVLLIDTSGSVKDKLKFEQMAASEFLESTLRKNKDMAAIVQFDSDIRLVQDFTYDISILQDRLWRIRAGGATKLYDAIWVSVYDLLREEVGRKVMVVLSDGADTQSHKVAEEAIRAAQGDDVVIYGVGVKSRRLDSDFGTLEKFARATGGQFFNPKAELEKLRDAFARINREIKNQYTLSYVSTNRRRDGSFREIEVRVRRRDLKVQHRTGYYAPGGDS